MSNYFQVLKRIEKDRAGKVAVIAGADVAPAATVPSRESVAGRDTPDVRPLQDLPATSLRSLRPLPDTAPATEQPGKTSAPDEAPARSVPPLQSVTSLQPMAPSAATRTATRRPSEPVPSPVRVRSAAPLSPERQRGIATLLDKIRTLGGGQATRTFVFAGAAASDSVHAVTDGLARHAERFGMHVLVAQLVGHDGGHRLVAVGAVERADERTRSIDLYGGAAPAELNAWVDRIAGTRDLVILEGPPLVESIDAALLACACDGLVIVADAEVTPRAALQTAAERAQTAGCRTLGVVMNGTKEHLPGWMRRLTGGRNT